MLSTKKPDKAGKELPTVRSAENGARYSALRQTQFNEFAGAKSDNSPALKCEEAIGQLTDHPWIRYLFDKVCHFARVRCYFVDRSFW